MFKDEKGKVSFMRVASFIGLLLGVAESVIGMIGFLVKIDGAIIVIGSSQALITLILGAKAWQKKSELNYGS